MRPSSSTSDGVGSALFGLFGAPDIDAELTDEAVLRAMLDVEAALVEAAADAGVVPRPAADAIARQCHLDRFDLADLASAAESAGNPVVPLVRALTRAVAEDAKPWVHHGATSQDILDSALVLVAVRASDPMLRHVDAATDACAGLARRYRDAVMVARTLGQQASPTTFGLKAANWLLGLLDARRRLVVARRALPVQLGGAVGTLAVYGAAGPDVADRLATRLGLAGSDVPWHTRRQPLLDLSAALAGLLAAAGKVALDVELLAQNEVGEVAEGGEGRGGSSAMPHKRNPVDSVLVAAAARRGPGLLATMYAAATQEHERAAGAWHAEWEPLLDLLRLAGGAAGHTRRLLDGLEVRADRMRANLDATGGLVMAESVANRLAPALGRGGAHDVVARAARQPDFRAALLADPAVREHLSERDVDAALDPREWLGCAGTFVDRALRTYRAARADRPPAARPDRAVPASGVSARGVS
ncbi:MAG TPA: 3-carboxy-cis,cis-muconate cycloisomerase [Micromonosporaceae bacterium]